MNIYIYIYIHILGRALRSHRVRHGAVNLIGGSTGLPRETVIDIQLPGHHQVRATLRLTSVSSAHGWTKDVPCFGLGTGQSDERAHRSVCAASAQCRRAHAVGFRGRRSLTSNYERFPDHRHWNLKAFREHIQKLVSCRFVTE